MEFCDKSIYDLLTYSEYEFNKLIIKNKEEELLFLSPKTKKSEKTKNARCKRSSEEFEL